MSRDGATRGTVFAHRLTGLMHGREVLRRLGGAAVCADAQDRPIIAERLGRGRPDCRRAVSVGPDGSVTHA